MNIVPEVLVLEAILVIIMSIGQVDYLNSENNELFISFEAFVKTT